MELKPKHFIVGGIIISMMIAGYLLVRYLIQQSAKDKTDNDKSQEGDESTTQTDQGGTKPYFPPTVGKPMSYPLNAGNYGAKGTLIESLQRNINKKYATGLAEDGIWGKNTHTAVKSKLGKNSIASESDLIKIIAGLEQPSAHPPIGGYSWANRHIFAKRDNVVVLTKDKSSVVKSAKKGEFVARIDSPPSGGFFYGTNTAGTWIAVGQNDVTVQ